MKCRPACRWWLCRFLKDINPDGCVPMTFTSSQSLRALQSTVADILDTLTVPKQPYQTTGGGTQYFVPNKSLMIQVPTP